MLSPSGEEMGSYMPCIQAVGRLWSGDIRVAAVMEEDRDQLMAAADRWLPKLSDLLSLACRTYPILVSVCLVLSTCQFTVRM